jgi:hypothetical protein
MNSGLDIMCSALLLFSVNVYKKLTENMTKTFHGKIGQGALARSVRALICFRRFFGINFVKRF